MAANDALIPDKVFRFFQVVLPHLVLRSFDGFLERQGSIAFDIKDSGKWTFHFGSEECVSVGFKEDAELRLTFTRKAFEAFLDGTLDVVAAVQAREVTAKGRDFLLLEEFGRILRPPARHDMGWDASTQG